jgi:hypothetical protein
MHLDPPPHTRLSWWWLAALAGGGVVASLLLFWSISGENELPNRLTAPETRDGWRLLFDGETTTGWQTGGAVTIWNGQLVLDDRGAPAEAGVHIPAHQFDLQFEYRMDRQLGGHFSIEREGGNPGRSLCLAFHPLQPNGWHRGTYEEGLGKATTRLSLSSRLRGLGAMEAWSDTESGSGIGSAAVTIGFQVCRPGDRLFLRSIKVRPLEGESPGRGPGPR